MRDYERRNANRKSVLQRVERKLDARPLTPGASSDGMSAPPYIARPAPRRRARAHRRLARLRRQRRRAPATATSCSSPARVPGDRVRAVVGKAKRAYAEARAVEMLEPSPDRIAAGRRPPGRAVAGAALRAPARGQGGAGRRRAAPHRPARRLRARADRARRSSSGATATSSSTRSAPAPTGELVCGFHAPGRWDEIVPIDDCLLASERGNAAARAGARRGAARRASAPGTGARSSGFLRNLVVREGRRTGELQVRLVTSPGKLDVDALIDAVDCRRPVLDADRRPRREHRRAARRRCSPARRSCAERARRPATS